MKAAQVMTRNVATIRPDESVPEAARKMLRFGISGLIYSLVYRRAEELFGELH
jgi:hypothetical protein